MSDFQRGLKAAVPTVLGYASIGFACGILAAQSGISSAETALMSLLVYSGSAQFAICGLVLAGTDLVSGVLTIFLLNLRNLLLNLHTTTVFKPFGLLTQFFLASMMTDESYGLLVTQQLDEDVTPGWMAGNNLAGYLSWLTFTVLGCLLGGLLPDPEKLGVDFALIVMFLTIFMGQWTALLKRIPLKRAGLILASVALVYLMLSIFVTGSVAVLVATLAGCFVGVMTDVD